MKRRKMEDRWKAEDNLVRVWLEGMQELFAKGNSIFLKTKKQKGASDKKKTDIEPLEIDRP